MGHVLPPCWQRPCFSHVWGLHLLGPKEPVQAQLQVLGLTLPSITATFGNRQPPAPSPHKLYSPSRGDPHQPGSSSDHRRPAQLLSFAPAGPPQWARPTCPLPGATQAPVGSTRRQTPHTHSLPRWAHAAHLPVCLWDRVAWSPAVDLALNLFTAE